MGVVFHVLLHLRLVLRVDLLLAEIDAPHEPRLLSRPVAPDLRRRRHAFPHLRLALPREPHRDLPDGHAGRHQPRAHHRPAHVPHFPHEVVGLQPESAELPRLYLPRRVPRLGRDGALFRAFRAPARSGAHRELDPDRLYRRRDHALHPLRRGPDLLGTRRPRYSEASRDPRRKLGGNPAAEAQHHGSPRASRGAAGGCACQCL